MSIELPAVVFCSFHHGELWSKLLQNHISFVPRIRVKQEDNNLKLKFLTVCKVLLQAPNFFRQCPPKLIPEACDIYKIVI